MLKVLKEQVFLRIVNQVVNIFRNNYKADKLSILFS